MVMRIAFFGTGLMGAPMARRLLAGGHAVSVWNRTPERARLLVADGARLAASPRDAIEDADVAVLMLADRQAVDEVLFSTHPPLALDGRTFIQMGTIAPAESEELAGRIQRAGGAYLEAPVLGSIPEAAAGTLQVMAGGDKELFDDLRSVLECFGAAPRLVGRVGDAAAIKLALNQLIASLTAAFSLSLGFVQAWGASPQDFLDILHGSALWAPTFEKKRPRMDARDFTNPNFPLKHLLKDVKLFLEASRPAHLDTRALDHLSRILDDGVARGLGDLDYSALHDVIAPPR
jgi:3-hydroxyisobutyrate dehydrogenase-like beta-hydroxyacid dehydrogenase